MGRTFRLEEQDGALTGILQSPIPLDALYLGKVLGNFLLLSVMVALVFLVFTAFFRLCISLLALKLAINVLMAERMQFHPVLILDDLFSELDATVRANLRQYLFQVPNQIFITSTEPGDAHDFPDPRIMEIRAGQIT